MEYVHLLGSGANVNPRKYSFCVVSNGIQIGYTSANESQFEISWALRNSICANGSIRRICGVFFASVPGKSMADLVHKHNRRLARRELHCSDTHSEANV